MSRSSAPQVLERPGTEREPASPADVDHAPAAGALDRPPLRAAVAARAPPTPPRPATAARLRGPSRLPGPFAGRRLPHPPGRRAPLWFAALVAGALLAGPPSLFGTAVAVTGNASDYGLGAAAELASPAGSTTPASAAASPRPRPRPASASSPPRGPPAHPKTVLPTQGRLTTCYCMRWGQMHYGLDLAAPLGTPIYSAADGVVLKAGRASGFGNAVYIQDADGNVHVYGHMRYYDVEAGRHRARRRPDREGRQRGLLDRPAPALRDPPRRHGRPPDRPRGLARRARRHI